MTTEIKTPVHLTTVRIMAINVRGYETHDILIVSELHGASMDEMKRIRIYLKEDEWEDYRMVNIADQFYKKLITFRQALKKNVYDRHLYKVYNEIKDVERNDVEGGTPFTGVRQLYLKKRKHPYQVLLKPRKGYKEIKSDSARLVLRDMIIKQEKEKYQELKDLQNINSKEKGE